MKWLLSSLALVCAVSRAGVPVQFVEDNPAQVALYPEISVPVINPSVDSVVEKKWVLDPAFPNSFTIQVSGAPYPRTTANTWKWARVPTMPTIWYLKYNATNPAQGAVWTQIPFTFGDVISTATDSSGGQMTTDNWTGTVPVSTITAVAPVGSLIKVSVQTHGMCTAGACPTQGSTYLHIGVTGQ